MYIRPVKAEEGSGEAAERAAVEVAVEEKEATGGPPLRLVLAVLAAVITASVFVITIRKRR